MSDNLLELTRKKTSTSIVTFQYKSNAFLKGVLLPNTFALPVSGEIHIQLRKMQCSVTYKRADYIISLCTSNLKSIDLCGYSSNNILIQKQIYLLFTSHGEITFPGSETIVTQLYERAKWYKESMKDCSKEQREHSTTGISESTLWPVFTNFEKSWIILSA